MKINRDEGHVELGGSPKFSYGEKVRSLKTIRNDGTFGGREIGDILVKKGDEGYVTSIGTFLQQFYIYGVDFIAHGYRVGMKGRELESMDVEIEEDEPAQGEAVVATAVSVSETAPEA